MIRFFRKIRQDLLTDNRFSKYLLYAIGEIILVVIGILLALQINNWNQDHLKKKAEIETLRDLKSEIEFDLKHIKYNLSQNDRVTNSIGVILEHLENDLPHHDSLNVHFNDATGIVFSKLNGSVFEALKSEGLDLVSNKNLRDTLIIAYGTINKWASDQYRIYHEYLLDASKNIFNTRFKDYWSIEVSSNFTTEMIPINYDALKTDQEYLYFLRTLRNLNFHYIKVCALTEQKMAARILELIDEEIKNSE